MFQLLLLIAVASAARVVIGDKKLNSAFVASFANDPASVGPNNVLILSMGSKGALGNMPPHVFVAFVNGSVGLEQIADGQNLFQKKIAVTDARALLYAHWGIGEWCDIDGKPGFGGSWPPSFGSLLTSYVDIALSREPFKVDTFLTAFGWNDAKFAPLETGKTPAGQSFATISTEIDAKNKSTYSMQCRSGDAQSALGEYRFKCDFAIRPDGLWFDQLAKPDLLPLAGNLKADDAVSQNKGCPHARRKFALLAFLAGTSIAAQPTEDMQIKGWLRVPIGDAEFAYVKTASILDASGKDTGKTTAVTAQIQPVSDIVDTKNWPPFLAESRAILFTFDASRADLSDGQSIFLDPTFGFASDPTKPGPLNAPPGATTASSTTTTAALAASALLAATAALF